MRPKCLLIFVCTMGMALALKAQDNLTLLQALESAKHNNPFLKPASLDISIAQSDVLTAGLRPNPVLNNQTLQLLSSKYFEPGTKFYNSHNNQLWWQLTKEFQFSGQRKLKQEVANKNVITAEKSYADIERNVLTDAGNKWLDVWYNKINLLIVQEARNNIDSLLKIQQIRLKNQVISTSDLLRTQLLLDQYQLQAKTASQEYANTLQQLKLSLGRTDNMDINESDTVINDEATGKVDSLLQISLAQRPDVQVVQSNIESAKSNIKLQKALGKPVPELGVIYNPQNTIQYAGLYGTIPLPFFNRNQGEIRKSKIQLQQSEQSLVAIQQQVQTEVKNAWNSYQLSKETVAKYKSILEKSEEVLQAVRYSYTRGGTTIIDFLDAQRTWFDTQKTYYEALYNYRKNYLQLLSVTGLINQYNQVL
ncbi:TolC family protein [Chitinophaga silvatica]|uniref:TolC family protein n=1 Tax=Chitinophaga silvatica TaxID=2282649 RepID=A0A3E1YHV8_9BACT|nr:TolC family protein [Chitinophaga silvatica]RFS26937.1 TolC family protein [Chitinophaga silvatica]